MSGYEGSNNKRILLLLPKMMLQLSWLWKLKRKKLKNMKRKLALTSRLHPARLHNSDEEEDGLGKK
jgi:hypothetical protein